MANTQASRDDTVDRGGRVNGWSRASADEITERDALAAGALQVLQAAGCPVQLSPDDCDRERGYVIEVDLGGDAGGGVFLMWNPGGTITAQARDAVLARDFTHPAIRFHGEAAHAMTTAALKILHAAGFTAVLADDDARPYELDIRAGSLDSLSWRL